MSVGDIEPVVKYYSGNQDPDMITDFWALYQGDKLPTPGLFYYVNTICYSIRTGNRKQIAYPYYENQNFSYIRTRKDNVWSGWEKQALTSDLDFTKDTTRYTPTNSGYTNLYDFLIAKFNETGSNQVTYYVNNFPEIPAQFWQFMCTARRTNGMIYATLYKEQSDAVYYTAGLNSAALQTNCKRIATNADFVPKTYQLTIIWQNASFSGYLYKNGVGIVNLVGNFIFPQAYTSIENLALLPVGCRPSSTIVTNAETGFGAEFIREKLFIYNTGIIGFYSETAVDNAYVNVTFQAI